MGRTEAAVQSVQVKALEVWMCTAQYVHREMFHLLQCLWVHLAAENFWCSVRHLCFWGQRWEYVQRDCSKGRKLAGGMCCLWARRSSTWLPLAWCSLAATIYMAINTWDIPIMYCSNSRASSCLRKGSPHFSDLALTDPCLVASDHPKSPMLAELMIPSWERLRFAWVGTGRQVSGLFL